MLTHSKVVCNATVSLGFLFQTSVYKCRWGCSLPINIDNSDSVFVLIVMSVR